MTFLLLTGLLITASHASLAPVPSDSATAKIRPAAVAKEGEQVIRGLINAIRYKKDGMALNKLACQSMAQALMEDAWGQLNSAEQKQFVTDLQGLLAATSFAKGRQMFAYLDAMLFSAPVIHGDATHIKSTIVVHRDLKKVEIPIEWVLTREQGHLRISDIVSMGESTAKGIRQEEVLPLLKEGGAKRVLIVLHQRLGELSVSQEKN